MPEWRIDYRLENGTVHEIVVPAISKFAAWESFKDISKDFDSKVVAADCYRVID